MSSNVPPVAVSIAEAANLLGVSRPTVYTLIHQEEFPAFKVGSRTLVSVDGLRAWVSNKTEVKA